ncbi:hypothetical protein HPB49_017917 [Dermacentor silvarum]|uniref:Uncharacterized protein n=1 Tax=Dermacentor silvarum TaxID=543639 RepID=A0ACB8D7C7_DERSI|nr:hypothetical protein HPB49_017917 [Dermacentor silvarum]
MTAHPAMPEGGKGVIYGINLELTEEQIHKALDNPRNPTYTAVRRLGRSSESVIINFKDLEVPKTVKFFSQWIPCHLYKKKYDVCYACGKIGHRQDVCPDPRSTRCRGCGLRNPPEEHACEPKCLLCGKKHQLGDPTCRELYRKPHWVKQRDAARAEARAEQEKGGATTGRSRPTSKVALPPAAKKQRSESRDRSASRPPPRDNQTHWPGLQKPGDKRTHSGMPVSFASAVSQGRTPELEAQANLFKKEIEKRDEENSQLREIIKTLTETVNQLKEQVGQLTNPTVRATQAEPTRPLTPVQRIAAPQAQDEGSMVVDTGAVTVGQPASNRQGLGKGGTRHGHGDQPASHCLRLLQEHLVATELSARRTRGEAESPDTAAGPGTDKEGEIPPATRTDWLLLDSRAKLPPVELTHQPAPSAGQTKHWSTS